MLILLSLVAADPAAMMKVADDRMAAARMPATPTRSRYRIAAAEEDGFDGKAAAVRTTGEQCAITGPTLCTKKPRTIFASSY